MRLARAAAVLLALAAPAAPAGAQGTPTAELAPESDPAVVALRDKLKKDDAALEEAAQRLARSRLISQLEPDKNDAARLAAARAWIKSDPDSAAHIMIGLAGDDASGKSEYEDALLLQFDKSYDAFRNRGGHTLQGLRKTGKQSQSLKKQEDELADDEKREILRTMFEGQGAQTDKILTEKDGPRSSPEKGGGGAAPATAFNGLYDRLGAGNLRGYSPQLLALQSALNARRPPGAPALVETGKLDYETLAYPAYGMRYDVDNLESRLRAERVLRLAALTGRTLTPGDWKDPLLESKLAAQAPADKLPPRLGRRAELVGKARAAQAAFLDAAAKAKAPGGLTRALLVELGNRQRETARWIADAALEEELSRAEELDGFLTPELLAKIDAVPAPADERAAYRRRGESLKAKVDELEANARKAQGLLESDGWAGALAEVDRLVAANRGLKRSLARNVSDYARAPYGVAEALVVQPRWRAMLDDAAVRWAPGLAYSRAVALRHGQLSRYMNAFGLAASGDAEGAHAALAAAEPGRR